jgi:GMP synthase (glutamine-hydrolysing)
MLLVFQHETTEGPGRLGAVLRDFGHHLQVVRTYAGDAIPATLADVDGVIILGGCMNTCDAPNLPWMQREIEIIKEAHAANIPVLGICLGAQLIAVALGGEVGPADKPEIGMGKVALHAFFGGNDPMLVGLPYEFTTAHAHGQEVKKAPANGTPAALISSKACKNQAFRAGLRTYGFQYHFEWTLAQIEAAIDSTPEWLTTLGLDAAKLKEEAKAGYARYEELGLRQCQLIAERLFAIEKRTVADGRNVENFHAHR